MLIVAYFLETGLVLAIVPWTTFWERNAFLSAWRAATPILLSPWLRGALSGIGAVTIGAGLLDLLDLFLQRGRARPESARTSG